MTCVELEDGPARATIALRGAELRRWVVDGRSLLWDPDPTIWDDTAPLLFPVVGWTKHSRIVVRDRSYPLGLHGFARHGLFRVAERSQSHVRLTLAHSAETMAVYPFAWDLAVTYVLEGNELMTELAVRNLGPAVMPYACGLHPGFRWPFADGEPEDYAIEFGEPERGEVPMISREGLFTRQARPVPMQGRVLELRRELFAAEALCFLHARSRTLRFRHGSGSAIALEFDDFPHIALWSRDGGSFLSIEAWTGHGDYVDADGDLFEKPSMRHLAPGAAASHRAKYSFVSAQPLFPPAGLAV